MSALPDEFDELLADIDEFEEDGLVRGESLPAAEGNVPAGVPADPGRKVIQTDY